MTLFAIKKDHDVLRKRPSSQVVAAFEEYCNLIYEVQDEVQPLSRSI